METKIYLCRLSFLLFIRFISNCSTFLCLQFFYFLIPRFFANSHITTPPQTLTFRECFVPSCGISRKVSIFSKASSLIPATSLPRIKAYFFSELISKSVINWLDEVCSIPIIWKFSFLRLSIAALMSCS